MGLFSKSMLSRYSIGDGGKKSGEKSEGALGVLESAAKLLGGSGKSYDELATDEKASDREIVVSFIKDYLKALKNKD